MLYPLCRSCAVVVDVSRTGKAPTSVSGRPSAGRRADFGSFPVAVREARLALRPSAEGQKVLYVTQQWFRAGNRPSGQNFGRPLGNRSGVSSDRSGAMGVTNPLTET
jgi:hypothetical protein